MLRHGALGRRSCRRAQKVSLCPPLYAQSQRMAVASWLFAIVRGGAAGGLLCRRPLLF
jgi:hypothetical protein